MYLLANNSNNKMLSLSSLTVMLLTCFVFLNYRISPTMMFVVKEPQQTIKTFVLFIRDMGRSSDKCW